jgi:hypothetical protein
MTNYCFSGDGRLLALQDRRSSIDDKQPAFALRNRAFALEGHVVFLSFLCPVLSAANRALLLN